MTNIERAVREVERHVRRTGSDPALAVRAVWPRLNGRLTAADKEVLMLNGLRNLVNDSFHKARQEGARTYAVRVTHEVPPAQRQQVSVWVNVVYKTPANGMRMLFDLDRQECRFVAQQHRQQADGLTRIAVFMEALASRLEQHCVENARALPDRVRAELEAAWPGHPAGAAGEEVA